MIAARRANRMARKHQRASRSTSINLVSLMDIFTILVFFLLVNSSDGEVLPTHKSIALPESVSEEIPRHTVTIMVDEENIMLHGKVIASVESLASSEFNYSEPLTLALKTNSSTLKNQKPDRAPVLEATIMGDREIPYSLLKKVIASCTEAGFERISLAVLQVPAEAG